MFPMAKGLPKPVAIVLIIIFYVYLARGLITGVVCPPGGARSVYRSEDPRTYWIVWISYFVGATFFAIMMCIDSKLI